MSDVSPECAATRTSADRSEFMGSRPGFPSRSDAAALMLTIGSSPGGVVPSFVAAFSKLSVARDGDRRGTKPYRLLGLQRPDIERPSGHQKKRDEIDRVGLRRRDRPPHKTSYHSRRTGFVFHAVVLREMGRDGKWQMDQMLSAPPAEDSFRSIESASSAERLSAEETIRMRLPMVSINKPNASGAMACAIRAGAPMMPRR
jgi:hypothetical protein